MRLLQQHLSNDRVLLPLMEVIAFLFDMQIMPRLVSTSFKCVSPFLWFKYAFQVANKGTSFRTLLAYTQKAHFKSTHMHKLHLALDIYRGLGANASTRAETLTKVTSMLLHPFPKVLLPHKLTCISLQIPPKHIRNPPFRNPANKTLPIHADSHLGRRNHVAHNAGRRPQAPGLEPAAEGAEACCRGDSDNRVAELKASHGGVGVGVVVWEGEGKGVVLGLGPEVGT